MMNFALNTEEEVLTVGERVTKKVVPTSQGYFQPDSGFGIYTVELEDGMLYTMKGKFPGELTLGNTYEVDANVVMYRGETQLDAKSIKIARAEGKRAVVFYLQTLKGLKTRAESIYDVFGTKTLEVLMNRPELVSSKIRGIGKVMATNWSAQLKEKLHEEELLLFLFGLGLNPTQVETLKKEYGTEVRSVLEDNPYRLIQDVHGYGFKKCDVIARSTGIEFDDLKRVRAGVLYVFQNSSNEGHTYLPKEELAKRLKETLCTPSQTFGDDLVASAIEQLLAEGEVVELNGRIFLTKFDLWEEQIVEQSRRLSKTKQWAKTTRADVERELDDYLAETGVQLEEKQREAVITFASGQGGFYILNGSAGCGKTFTLKVILIILELIYRRNRVVYKVKVMAPTGKASKVASRATGLPCTTIHNGLEFNPEGGFDRNEDTPLEETVVVLDETSMLDTEIAKDLLLAIADGAKVIFMGDTKQLPSVGAGNVLMDLIASGVAEVVTLNVVKRQGEDSGIIENANRIIRGEMIETQPTGDSYVIATSSDDVSIKKLIASNQRLLELGYPMSEIQVLTPMRKGKLGTYNLNRVFQQEFNPNGETSTIKNWQLPPNEEPLFFRTGDKVIHIKNDKERSLYTKRAGRYTAMRDTGITNGECGVIESIEKMSEYSVDAGKTITFERMIVAYEDWYVFYDTKADIEMLDHAFALTIHKSQGSQWDAVLIPISTSHTRMLDNNLLYTGNTRARKFQGTIGALRALMIGIKTQRSADRYTGLQLRFSA
jgi:exodeoxyribonuclease V alpha subunit